MNVDTGQILTEVLMNVLERIAFMFGEVVGMSDVPGIETECVRVAITFKGEIEGRIEMIAPIGFCTELAASVLGTNRNEDMAEKNGIDSLKELLNVTCGNFVTAVAGDRSIFHVGIPSTQIVSACDWKTTTEENGWMAILVDENPILVRLSSGD